MNPCPCGYATDPTHHCTCSRHAILKYLRKISGPLLDRIDLCIPVPKVETEKLLKKTLEVASSQFLKSVYGARRIQYKRFRASGHFTNAEMSPKELEMFCLIDDESQKLMKIATEKLSLSARGYTRVLKIARTIADLAQSQSILAHHLSEALTYRPGIEIFTK
ncbi:hypothetical protein CO172_03645 [Candidatus Uhrbacteria bacterium CG_4_9_14_3_um_filter_36_7]|uniref:Magnesium chelatase n=1 Tax=Candidatus Uhrbacteria bacterium CG_4_9_14_3_um_filter_36_7 TaxID=1975033 RepID=A0A2M7XG74_9BACT|nr:MAG: hypothetical protein CO172_03645 [Candidatus Uhrbacteria bacterium CG_4_9_14_3_um_filter_36_7]